MTNDCDRSHSVMSRHNYMRKRNWQLYWSSMESQTVLFDSRRCTTVRQDALRWNWMSQAKMRASTSLRQFWLTHGDALHFQIQCSDSSGCNTRIKVKHQITKLLTQVLRRQRIDLAPRQGGGTILSPQSIIGAGHNYIPIIKVWKLRPKAVKLNIVKI